MKLKYAGMLAAWVAAPLMTLAQEPPPAQEILQEATRSQALPMPAADAPVPASAEQPEVILVTGHLPGPPLWKVSKGDNVLWIFGMLDRIPVNMQWDSARVERVLSDAEVYIPPPGQGVSVGLLTGLRLLNPVSLVRGYSLMKRLNRDPDGKPLQQTLTPSLYQRFLALKMQYFPNNNDIEQYRPFTAMDSMRQEVGRHEGLGSSAPIRAKIEKLAQEHRKLQRINTSVITKLDTGYGELAERAETLMKSLPRDKELSCFDQELNRMEVDTEAMKRRANAWAQGNIDEFRQIVFKTGEEEPCLGMLIASSEGELLGTLLEQAREKWLAAAEQTLIGHQSSFAVLDIRDLLAEDGLLARLRAKGYDIREPE